MFPFVYYLRTFSNIYDVKHTFFAFKNSRKSRLNWAHTDLVHTDFSHVFSVLRRARNRIFTQIVSVFQADLVGQGAPTTLDRTVCIQLCSNLLAIWNIETKFFNPTPPAHHQHTTSPHHHHHHPPYPPPATCRQAKGGGSCFLPIESPVFGPFFGNPRRVKKVRKNTYVLTPHFLMEKLE